MTKKYDLAVKVGEYQDQSGATKGRYRNVGVVMEGQNGLYILLDRTFNPAGVPGQADRESIIVSLFEPRDQSGGKAGGSTSGQSGSRMKSELEDDIPFITKDGIW